MSELTRLLDNYRRYVALPWAAHLSGGESVWFAIYPPAYERKVLHQIGEFELLTRQAGKEWLGINLSSAFTKWLDQDSEVERTAMFRVPDDLISFAKEDFGDFLVEEIKSASARAENPEQTVFAIYGLTAIYDFHTVSALLHQLDRDIRGRLLIFFPGSKNGTVYHFLDAREGWDYQAVAIDSHQEQFL